MHLEKLEIHGFKSFAQKTVLAFPRPEPGRAGITAIVGPNGSGKSNLAEAVRWVLGEQSLKQLRGKKSQDIIFSGSKGKSRLGLAETALYLNNESGAVLPDYKELVIKRRLYRSGESEYLINNNRVRLADVQILLAQANFGQRTYSVIGQGMVDAILAASPWERKEFFDEATGVKQYQIKRAQALQKINATATNLVQAWALLKEITPRLRALERAVKKLEAREKVNAELLTRQRRYYGYLWQNLAGQRNKLTAARESITKEYNLFETQVKKLQTQLAELEKQTKTDSGYEHLHQEYQRVLEEKSALGAELNRSTEQSKDAGAGLDSKALLAALHKQRQFLEKVLQARQPSDWKKLQTEAASLRTELINIARLEKPSSAGQKKTDPLEAKMAGLVAKVTDLTQQLAATREQERTSTTAVFSLQKDYQAKQQILTKLIGEKNQIEVELARLETRQDDLEQELTKELPPAGQEYIKTHPITDQTAADLWPEIAKTKHELEMIGGIEPETAADYTATRERHDWLKTQITDLEEGLTKTKQILKELEAIIAREFDAAFAKIKRGFGEYFSILFQGGKAELEMRKTSELETLTEEAAANLSSEEVERLAQTHKIGIEVRAAPPHKRITNLAMLSGGERALTSIALICAIIRANPSPFVVLDEVDAALDEANSERFAAILERLAHTTQFITITHNRATMERASILYGVTMGEDGVSKLLSVDLEKAVENTKR